MNPWLGQCPARGYGLSHAHDRDCIDGHIAGQCCECGGFPGPQVAERPSNMVMPPLDVQARLRSLGMIEETDMEDIRGAHDDDTPVEPRLARGQWQGDTYVPGEPQGKPSGPGRGGLTPRQKQRLIVVDEQERWLDERARR